MTKKTMVSGVKVLALLLLVNVAVVQARQVLLNENMNGCTATPGVTVPLDVWEGTSGGICGDNARPCSANTVELVSGGPTAGSNDCAARWNANPGFSPISQTLNLQAGEAPGLFDFQAFWACFGSSGFCSLSLTIREGSTPTLITLSEPTTKSATSSPSYDPATTATGISISNPNAIVEINCVTIPGTNCFLTQATLSTQGTVIGDPHFKGLDGQRFDTTGEPGSSYNLITDSDLQVCCLLLSCVFFFHFL